MQSSSAFLEPDTVQGHQLEMQAPLAEVGWVGSVQKSKTAIQQLGSNLRFTILIKSFCDTGSHRHWSLSNKPLLRVALRFLDCFCLWRLQVHAVLCEDRSNPSFNVNAIAELLLQR